MSRREQEQQTEGKPGEGYTDPNLLAAVGGYQSRRRPGWYLALVLLGFGLGAVLALAVGQRTPPGGPDQAGPGAASGPTAEPIRAGLVFATSVTPPPRTPDMLPAGVKIIYCHFRLPGVKDIRSLSGSWSYNGEAQGQIVAEEFVGKISNGAAVGYAIMQAPSEAGFAKGIYEVTVSTAEDVVRESSFVVVQDPDKILSQPVPQGVGVRVTDATICRGVTKSGEPQGPQTAFASDDQRVYLAFKFSNAEPGSVVRIEWQFHGQAISSASREITLEAAQGWAHGWIGRDQANLFVPGSYRAVVKSVPDGEPLASATFLVKAAR